MRRTGRTASREMKVEGLESREVMSGPSPEAQYLIQVVNAARMNPGAEIQKLTSNLDATTQATLNYYGVNLGQATAQIGQAAPRQPLAWNASLTQAAQYQSNDQAQTGVQSHVSANGSTLADRVNNAGYSNVTGDAEDDFAYATSLDNAMQAFLIDWGNPELGHRNNLLQPNATDSTSYGDIGVGLTATSGKGLGPDIVTVDFGRQSNAKAQVVGVAYNDADRNNFYSVGEGVGNVTITAINKADGSQTSVQTWDAGGYALPLGPGNYTIRASVGNNVVRSQDVTIGSQNVEVDFVLSNPWSGQTVSAPAPVAPPTPIAPAPTPTIPTSTVLPILGRTTITTPTPTPTPVPVVAPVVSIAPMASTPAPATTPSAATSTDVGDSSLLDGITDWTSWSV